MTPKKSLIRLARRGFDALGIEVRRKPRGSEPTAKPPVELTAEQRRMLDHVRARKLSMASSERLWATTLACQHVVDAKIDGAFVECGVWRGGNSLLAASVFRTAGQRRALHLFDTYEGMTAPTDDDRRVDDGTAADGEFRANDRGSHNAWCYASLDDVRANFEQAGLLTGDVRFVVGDVLKTLEIHENLPDRIAVLRLDTDWYESTKRELEVLYPRLAPGGVLIVDDYGHWAGSKKATDEYFERHGGRPFLSVSDYAGRIGIKPG